LTLKFIDLFAGIGGFHEALESINATCVFASEIDPRAREIYLNNRGDNLDGEFNEDFNEIFVGSIKSRIPNHDILTAGFPCQPFSKSGFQRGLDDIRGNHFLGIARIIEERRPRVVVLENVRNLVGPKHNQTWTTIREILRGLGYLLPDFPTIFSPHLFPPELGGTPQSRERVFIVAVRDDRRRKSLVNIQSPLLNKPFDNWDPNKWDLAKSVLQRDHQIPNLGEYLLTAEEISVIEIWEEFVNLAGSSEGRRLPGFPFWADEFRVKTPDVSGLPLWKVNFILNNHKFYTSNKAELFNWLRKHNYLADLSASKRKLEWQADDMSSIWKGLIQFRPSGVRVKKPTYAPALVAMNQTSIYGPKKRRLTVREAARLQGFNDSLDFGTQLDSISYKQLGNAVAPKTALFVLRECSKFWPFFPQDIRDELIK
jgi:DNA (cytosine-5)-methyltransferase 1